MTHIYELPDAPECTDNLPHGVWTLGQFLIVGEPRGAVALFGKPAASVVMVPLCHDGSEDY